MGFPETNVASGNDCFYCYFTTKLEWQHDAQYIFHQQIQPKSNCLLLRYLCWIQSVRLQYTTVGPLLHKTALIEATSGLQQFLIDILWKVGVYENECHKMYNICSLWIDMWLISTQSHSQICPSYNKLQKSSIWSRILKHSFSSHVTSALVLENLTSSYQCS